MARKVLSLLPSGTEIICLVGGRDDLVGLSHECDYPSDLTHLPRVSSSRVNLELPSATIDRSIRDLVAQALSIYQLDIDQLELLDFDLVITQDLCEVCAINYKDVRNAVNELLEREVEIINLRPKQLGDVLRDIERVGAALGREQQARQELEGLRRRIARVQEAAEQAEERPKVVSIEWMAPVMLGGTWMPELIEWAGGAALGPKAGEYAPTVDREELEALDPDVVLVKPCGYSLKKTQNELHLLTEHLPWDRWSAVQNQRVYIADGNAYFNRSGPRLVDSLEILAACLHPDVFSEFTATYRDAVVRLDSTMSYAPLS